MNVGYLVELGKAERRQAARKLKRAQMLPKSRALVDGMQYISAKRHPSRQNRPSVLSNSCASRPR